MRKQSNRMTRPDDLSRYRLAIRKGSMGPDLPDFSERVRLRESVWMSRRAVAELLGVSERTIWDWESRQDPRNVGHPRAYRRLLQAFREDEAQSRGDR